jgi:hypothetical protein
MPVENTLGKTEYALPGLKEDPELLLRVRTRLNLLGLNELSTIGDVEEIREKLDLNPQQKKALRWVDQQISLL